VRGLYLGDCPQMFRACVTVYWSVFPLRCPKVVDSFSL
jgi:hypothetical protein